MSYQITRRALLIAADKYQDEELCLPAAKNDVRDLAAALEAIGYEVVGGLLSSEGFLVTKLSLQRQICNFFEQAKSNDELLLYFSGHGIEQDGLRLILSQDYDRYRPPHPSDLVGDEHLYRWARRSPAQSVLILVDACREGVKLVLEPEAGAKKAPLNETRSAGTDTESPTVAIVYSCASHERSWTSPGVNGFSFFTRALCETLKHEPESATLNSIIDSAQVRLSQYLSEIEKPNQKITLDQRPIHGRAGKAEQLILRHSSAEVLRRNLDESIWCQEIRDCRFWPKISESPELAERLCVIVFHCEAEFNEARSRVPDDRWRDERAPTKIVRQVEQLLGEAWEDLTVPEMALALVVPYVYEAVLAAGVLLLRENGDPLNPLADEEDANASRAWFAWRNTWLSDEQRLDRHELLLTRDKSREAVDLVSWHLNRFLHSNGEMWEYSPQVRSDTVCWIASALKHIFRKAPLPNQVDPKVEQLLQSRRLVRLARLMFSDWLEIEHIRKTDKKYPLPSDERFGVPADDWAMDEASLAHLLSIAAAMSVDPRRLDSVIAEHLGMSPGFDAKMLSNKFRESAWYSKEDSFILRLDCPHEAIDLALRNVVEIVDEHRRHLDTSIKVTARMRDALPRHFSDDWVKASELEDGGATYTLPHLQLTLDQKRVFQLLMGRSLYSERETALRELYQNAVDACRLRRARVQYVQKIAHKRNLTYNGEIVFRVSADDEGNPFIECQDNGIGMAERHLHHFFARAGQRFTDSHEFQLEKAVWAAEGVQFFPNSRFGIGVFSYFMLADEIRIETRRLAPNAIDMEPGLTASIVGGSSLFRIRAKDDLGVGTTVRLYLNRIGGLEKLLESMLKWLWLPEFNTTLVNYTGEKVHLEAGRLSPHLLNGSKCIAVPTSYDHNNQQRIFWNPRLRRDKNAVVLLADGILTENKSKVSADCLIVNLNGEIQPELSVDRSHINSWAKGYEHVVECLRLSNCRELLEIPEVTLVDLADAFSVWPLPLVLIDRASRAGVFEDDARNSATRSPELKRPLRELDPGDMEMYLSERLQSLLARRVGIAPVLDRILLQPDRSRNRKEPADEEMDEDRWLSNLLYEGNHADAIARWIAGRALALYESGWKFPEPIEMLAHFAAKTKLRDQPSVGLLLFDRYNSEISHSNSISIIHMLQVCNEWSLTLDEVKYLVRPLAELGVSIPNLDQLPTGVDLHKQVHRILDLAYKRKENVITIPGLLVAALELSLPVSELSGLLEPLMDFGIDMPDLEPWKSLSEPTMAQKRILTYVLRSVRDTQELMRNLLKACSEFEEADVVNLVRWLTPLSPLAGDVRAFLESEPLRIIASANLDGRPPWNFLLWNQELLAGAIRLGKSLREVQNLVSELEPIGIQSMCTISVESDFYPTEDHLRLLKNTSGIVYIGDLLEFAADESLKWSDALDLAKHFSDHRCSIPALQNTDEDFVPLSRHLELLSFDLSGKYIDIDRLPVGRLVAAAIKWAVTIGDVIEMARPLVTIGVQIPKIDSIYMNFRPTEQHALLMSRELDGRAPWFDFVPGSHLLAAMISENLTMDELGEISLPLVAMGAAASAPRVEQELLSRRDVLEFLSEDLDGDYPWIEEATPFHILKACVRWAKPWGEMVQFATQLGLMPTDSPALISEVQQFRPTVRHLQVLSKKLSENDVSRDGSTLIELDIGHIFFIANSWTLKLSEVVQLLLPLEQVGIVELPNIDLQHQGFMVSEFHLLLVSQDLDGLPDWTDRITLQHLQKAAHKLSWPLSRVVQTALPLHYIGIEVPYYCEGPKGVNERVCEILDTLGRYQTSLRAWDIATTAVRHRIPITEYAKALEVLASMGVDVEEAQAFVRFAELTGKSLGVNSNDDYH